MNFLEANEIISGANLSRKISYILAASCQLDKMEVYIKALSIKNGFMSDFKLLPFNTLNQYLISPDNSKRNIILLFPWDLCSAFDWRLGVSESYCSVEEYIEEASIFLEKIEKIEKKKVIYFDFYLPPTLLNSKFTQILKLKLSELVLTKNYSIFSGSGAFSLSSYLAFGCPFSSKKISGVSNFIVSHIKDEAERKKVLITDFDNVMWRGVIGEDGVEGIQYAPEGSGYNHFIYQTYLNKLKSAGILIAGVTRNDENLANLPFQHGDMPFKVDSFVALMASYNAKSSQIIELSKHLNLPLDSFVFVDDNPIELEEVSSKCPSVTCIAFPKKMDGFTSFMQELAQYFETEHITREDKKRTEMYKLRTKGISPSIDSGSDLTKFLLSLEMKIEIKICDESNSSRAIQLINKTNQFNSNGVRLTEEEASLIFKNDFKLISFRLIDKHGDHGEIAVILLNSDNALENFVVSCRVFQRKIEHFILLWIYKNLSINNLSISYIKTEKNIPFQEFISSISSIDEGKEGSVFLDLEKFFSENKHLLDLFEFFI